MKLKWIWQKVKKLNLKWFNRDGKGKPKSYPTPEVQEDVSQSTPVEEKVETTLPTQETTVETTPTTETEVEAIKPEVEHEVIIEEPIVDVSQSTQETDTVLEGEKPTVTLTDTVENVSVPVEVISQGMTVPVMDMIPAGVKKGETTVSPSKEAELLEVRRRLVSAIELLDSILPKK